MEPSLPGLSAKVMDKSMMEACKSFLPATVQKIKVVISDKAIKVAPTQLKVWTIGLIIITLITLSSLSGIAFMPIRNKARKFYNMAVIFFVGLAVGCLTGSALFELLPQSFLAGLNHTAEFNYLEKSWVWIAGIYMFYFADRILKFYVERQKARCGLIGDADILHQCNGLPIVTVDDLSDTESSNNESDEPIMAPRKLTITTWKDVEDGTAKTKTTLLTVPHRERKQSRISNIIFAPIATESLETAAVMIFVCDGLHHFVDGLSIGVACTSSTLSGLEIGISIFVQEFPHELGDVALLLASGLPWRKALLYNLLCTISSYFGFLIGVLIGQMTQAATHVLALNGGIFLYVALSTLLPEMRLQLQQAIALSFPKAITLFILQTTGIMMGLIAMFILALYADDIDL